MADWYYTANGQQAGPIDVQTLRQMIESGSLAPTELVYGPGLTQWTPIGHVPALAGANVQGMVQQSPAVAPMIGYRGAEMDAGIAGLSGVAMTALRDTKPWVRFISIMMFIFTGLMVVGGLMMLVAGAMMSNGRSGALPTWIGPVYIALAVLYFLPALWLTRYANSIGSLMRTQRMFDVEQALGAQKSFWKFSGIMMIVVICLYFVGIAVAVIVSIK